MIKKVIDYISRKTVWCLKQLLPLKYRSFYIIDGQEYYSEWRMWFGVCYNIKEYFIEKPPVMAG